MMKGCRSLMVNDRTTERKTTTNATMTPKMTLSPLLRSTPDTTTGECSDNEGNLPEAFKVEDNRILKRALNAHLCDEGLHCRALLLRGSLVKVKDEIRVVGTQNDRT